ncbi:hypothetical protein [Motiliproteus sp. SC1-56]|uniref:hypothetical protein n=1 Tax=Motiliproteus sp. SC1-56 TaxID=2799565 RepID=UPI001A8E9121|nr:hypothetical protein [Motiliproteus sp. SC1-56]
MTAIEIRNRDRIIEELKVFIKKVLVEPQIAEQCLSITRELIDEEDAERKIAERVSATTNVKIPNQHSDADKLFLQILREVVRDEKALY